eukprot:CAMPEP_0197619816 /NCGR_PEP_ID=MMETSP1338-20131121/807_1 /TAXON_ID=43686 ORGANISM="Pelagodinium beii, Strain RCC1491" /NCGR_SAMPLE_ID=MMETSP1338 /ASSEMBLY_ACC=CAM_ASM_000754 /LENGTH=75 /DNA_ID=CAMNT_0043188861 /DNA_START=81 /DNA_END=308 /DNA_ORIENTATION=-
MALLRTKPLMALKIGAMKVGAAGGGGFGGPAIAGFLSLLHGYCFGYCVYTLVANPIFIKTRLAIYDRFPGLKGEE